MWSWIGGLVAVVAIISAIFYIGVKYADGPWGKKYETLNRSYTEFREMVKLGHSDAQGQYNATEGSFALQAKFSKEFYDDKSKQDNITIANYRAGKLRDSETIRRQFGAIDALTSMRTGSLCESGDARDPELSRRFDRFRNGILDKIVAPNQKIKRYAQKCLARLMHIETERIKQESNFSRQTD